jgi:phospholipase C
LWNYAQHFAMSDNSYGTTFGPSTPGALNLVSGDTDWPSTAVVIAYDDSDGWYDHAYSGVTNPSQGVADALTGPGSCGDKQDGNGPLAGQLGRCGLRPPSSAAGHLPVGPPGLR